MAEDLTFFNPWADIQRSENHLPHWQQPGATYFVTFRLGDALPQNLVLQLKTERDAWLRHHPEPWSAKDEAEYHERFSSKAEVWLDEGHGECLLRHHANAAIVAEALGFFDNTRYVQHAWVVMPNHVHTLFSLHEDWSLDRVMHTWKGVAAHRLPGLTSRLDGSIWQKDYFDRLIRDTRHFFNCVRYIRRNPDRARLREGEYLHYESEIARDVE